MCSSTSTPSLETPFSVGFSPLERPPCYTPGLTASVAAWELLSERSVRIGWELRNGTVRSDAMVTHEGRALQAEP